MDKVSRAEEFARKRHQGQLRSGSNIPYIVHPISVCNHLKKILEIKDEDILAAALLHDTLEDTKTSYEELYKEFGKRVANLVLELTNDKSLPKEERKAKMIEKAKTISRDAKIIRLADRYDNVLGMENWTEDRKSAYIKESRKLLNSLSGTDKKMEKLIGDKIKDLEDKITTW